MISRSYQNQLKATFWMSGTLVSFSLMAIAARELSGEIGTFQILFFRSLIGLLVISLIIFGLKRQQLFSTGRLKQHICRNLFHFAGQYGWFLGITLLPLAEVFALEFTVPFWTLIIAVLFLREQFIFRKLFAVLLGLTGVYIIVQPGSEVFNEASLIVLASAIFYAVAHSTTKALSSTEKPLTILFFMCLLQLPVSLVFSVMNWHNPDITHWFWLTIISLTALTAHYCMTSAMQCAEVTTVITLDFLRLPLISMVGMVLYNEGFDLALIIGGLLMLLGNLINLHKIKVATVNSNNK